MNNPIPILAGAFIRLEPLEHRHVDGLSAAAAVCPSLYTYASVPQGKEAAIRYVDTAQSESTLPFAIVRCADGAVIGATRLFFIEHWAWPDNHPRRILGTPDGCEAGYTWLTQSALRTPANTEAKLLLLTHAFEALAMLRVCFHADIRNTRSAAALKRIGAKREGVLRAHRLAVDGIPRDSLRFSILAPEWPGIKEKLKDCLKNYPAKPA